MISIRIPSLRTRFDHSHCQNIHWWAKNGINELEVKQFKERKAVLCKTSHHVKCSSFLLNWGVAWKNWFHMLSADLREMFDLLEVLSHLKIFMTPLLPHQSWQQLNSCISPNPTPNCRVFHPNILSAQHLPDSSWLSLSSLLENA